MSAWNANVQVGSFWGFPVKLELATESSAKASNVSFKTVHTACMTPIKLPKYCPTCDVYPEAEDLGKGYLKEKGEPLVLVDEDALAALKAEPASELQIVSFCPVSEVDAIFFDRTYYLVPDGKEDGYAVFLRALEQDGLGAICSYVRAGQEKWGFMRPLEGILGLETLFLAEDVRVQKHVLSYEVTDEELDLAKQMIKFKQESFDPTMLFSSYRESLHALLAGGKKKTTHKPVVKETMTAALRASVAEIKKQRKKAA